MPLLIVGQNCSATDAVVSNAATGNMFELAAGTKILVDGFYPVGTTGGPVAGSQFHSFKASPGNIANRSAFVYPS
jgi:hypothetical protein